jgi:hypothetical protein
VARDTTKRQYWTKQIRNWQTSGLAQRAYCAREGIKWPTFDYWRRQILSVAGAPTPTKTPATGGLTLVPVHVASTPSDETIVLRGLAGWELRLPMAVDPTWLTDVLKRLA